MCEKNRVDSNFVLSSRMKTATVVRDLYINQQGHLVIPTNPCYKCGANCYGFILNGDTWYGLNEQEFAQYQNQIKDKPEDLFIPG